MEGFGITGLLLLSLVLTTSGFGRYSDVQMEPNSLINFCLPVSYHKTGFKSIMSTSCSRHSSSADLLYKK